MPIEAGNESMYYYVELSIILLLCICNDKVDTLLITQTFSYCVTFCFFVYQYQINEGG